MAITFARLTPVRLTVSSGAVRVLAYTARTAIYDPRIQKVFDYTRLKADLSCSGIILPDGHPLGLADLTQLAVHLDRAEFVKVRTPLTERSRLPQVGLALVVALPPDGELWPHEADELMQRIVRRPRGSEAIAIHWAIHEAFINRHGHAYYALRAFDDNGNAGPRERDLMVRHRSTILGTGIVEGVDWPLLVWEAQQTYFEELGLDLVVDPIAPAPGTHLPPVAYANGEIHNEQTRVWVARSREDAHTENVEAIRGDPSRLVETLLRGRSSMRVAELERLCAKFVDHPSERMSLVERILNNDGIVTLTEDGSDKPRYLTNRRVLDLVAEAAGLIDRSSKRRVATFTAADQASVVQRIAGHYHANGRPERPLILGHALADCEKMASALASHAPIPGTIDMAATGPDYLLAIGSERDLAIHPGRTIIVPHAERIDDQRLAKLLQVAERQKAIVVLGHDQSSRLGIVDRGLAAYAADRTGTSAERYGQGDVERLLRAGLIRLAINAMADSKLLRFGDALRWQAESAYTVIVCQDRARMNEYADTIREQHIDANVVEPAVELTTFRGTISLSVGEWVVTTRSCEDPSLDVGQFAQIVGIAPSMDAIEVAHQGVVKRIDLEKFADIRSANTVSIREASGLPQNMRLGVELTGPRHIWAALLLVARRHAHAQLYVHSSLARSVDELTEIAGRSLPAALPHQRETKPDLNADTEETPKPLPELEEFPEFHNLNGDTDNHQPEIEDFPKDRSVPPDPPRPIQLEERIRSMIVSSNRAYEGYRMLFNYVGPHNPDGPQNMDRVLGLCTNELTAILIRFLAGRVEEPVRDELCDFDFPRELPELDPVRWSIQDIENAKYDLQTITIQASDWQLRPPPSAAPGRALES